MQIKPFIELNINKPSRLVSIKKNEKKVIDEEMSKNFEIDIKSIRL